jgi:uncharacterized protein (TIGR02996 family)
MAPSPTYAALLRAVLESPDDDLPRLVLADWLEENNNEAEARSLRRDVAEQHAVQIPLPGEVEGIAVRKRGFIENIAVSLTDFLMHHKHLFEVHPITIVWFQYLYPLDFSYTDDGWAWLRQLDGGRLHRNSAELLASVPDLLYLEMDGGLPDSSGVGREKRYETVAIANDALSRAAVAVGRKAAGLTPYTWPG